jgi:hypothetical protein
MPCHLIKLRMNFCTSKVISVSDEGKMANKASCLGFNKRSDDGIWHEEMYF